jgi:probable lipoprotein NlpC
MLLCSMLAPTTTFYLWLSLLAASADAPPGSQQELINRVVAKAQSFIGTPYDWGGESESGMDCSGLMVLCFQSVGIELPRVSVDQARKGYPVPRWDIQRGDMVFFEGKYTPQVGHVGLVMHTQGREVWFVHSSASQGVVVSRISEPYWRRRYHSARRLWAEASRLRQAAPPPYSPSTRSTSLSPVRSASSPSQQGPAWMGFQASGRKLTPAEVEAMSPKNRVKTQAYILARYGWQFEQPEIHRYFLSSPWYQALPQIDDPEVLLQRLTRFEKHNLRLIDQYLSDF